MSERRVSLGATPVMSARHARHARHRLGNVHVLKDGELAAKVVAEAERPRQVEPGHRLRQVLDLLRPAGQCLDLGQVHANGLQRGTGVRLTQPKRGTGGLVPWLAPLWMRGASVHSAAQGSGSALREDNQIGGGGGKRLGKTGCASTSMIKSLGLDNNVRWSLKLAVAASMEVQS
jgi:hypothetical protein